MKENDAIQVTKQQENGEKEHLESEPDEGKQVNQENNINEDEEEDINKVRKNRERRESGGAKRRIRASE